jgi:MFS family permease
MAVVAEPVPKLKITESAESQNQERKEEEEDNKDAVATNVIEVPDGGYGWVVVLSVFLFNISTWASNSGFAIYLAYYLEHDQFKGATKLDYAAVGGIAFGVGLFFMPLILKLKDFTNVRVVIALGGVFQFAGIFLAAFSKELWQIFLTQGLLIGIGLALITGPSTVVLPQWFRKRRTLAQSIASAGSGAGGVMFNLAMQAIIKNLSLRWALVIQAIICTVCTTTGILLLRTRDHAVKVSTTLWDFEVFASFGFFLMSLYVVFTLLGYVVLLYNLADFTKSLGYSASQGAIVSCMVSAGAFFGRPMVGRCCDKFGVVTTNIFAHLVVAILCYAMWIPARNYATAIAFAFLQGGLMGSTWVSQQPICARIFGLRKLSSVSGMLFTLVGLSGTASPIIGIKLRGDAPAGEMFDPSQYRNPAIYCGTCYLASSIALWLLRSYLIARDETAEHSGSHIDNDELHIKVSWSKMISKIFKLSKTRKV